MEAKDNLIKMATLVGPLFASSLAVCFDVGFFYGLNIGFFTFFSLTEHLVFALQALPFALIPALTVVGMIIWFLHAYSTGMGTPAGNAARLQAMDPVKRAKYEKLIEKQKGWVKYYVALTSLLLAGTFVHAVWRGRYSMAVFLLFVPAVGLIVAPFDRLEASISRRLLAGVAVVSLCWAIAFALGYERARDLHLRKYSREKVVIENTEMQVIVIRGGERGVLVKIPETGSIVFLRWDKITRIETF